MKLANYMQLRSSKRSCVHEVVKKDVTLWLEFMLAGVGSDESCANRYEPHAASAGVFGSTRSLFFIIKFLRIEQLT